MPRHAWHSMNTAMATHTHSHEVGRSAAASLIFVAMLLAALSLWTALPLSWIYIGSKVSKTQFPAEAPYAVVIVGLIASIVLVAWLISRLNRLYTEVTGTNRLAPMRPSWMRSMRDSTAPANSTTVVEAVLMGSVFLAALALSTWFFLLAGSPLPDQ